MRKFLLATLFSVMSLAAVGQTTGSIVGLLTDKEFNNEPLAFANVIIKGQNTGTTSDFDGLYALEDLPVGTYTIIYSFVGYETVEIDNITVEQDKVTTVNVPMGASAATLEEVVITTTVRKESEVALLLQQKNAVTQKTAIGAQELSRKGVGDAATAVSKVTGISKQEGSGTVFVRGLGDRYNVTTFNGLPLPSDDPARKNINLGIFNTNIVENIGIDKTFNPNQYADFAGANINIDSKNSMSDGIISVSVNSGINTLTQSQDEFFRTDGPDNYGFYDINYPAFPLNNYNFETSWDRRSAEAPANLGLTLQGGDSFQLGDDTKLTVFGIGAHSNQFQYREGVSRGGVEVSGIPNADFDYVNYQYSTNTTLMGDVGIKHKNLNLNYSGLFLNTSNEQQLENYGVIDKDDDASQGGGFIQRGVFTSTNLIINQLHADFEINERIDISASGSYSFLQSAEPNRRQVTLVPQDLDEPDGPKSFEFVSAASSNHRFYADLYEEEIASAFETSIKLFKNTEDEFDGKLDLGFSSRNKEVDFSATQFNFRILRGAGIVQPIVENIYDVDAYFNQDNLNAGLFRMETFRGSADVTNALDPQTYGGTQSILAGYANFTYTLNPQLTMVVGLRGEQINQDIAWSTSLDPDGDSNSLDVFQLLPALSMKYSLSDDENLKFAASKTYTLPQYKERAPFLFQEVNQDYFGNPFLTASTNYNFDAKWELFPSDSELLSVAVFGKLIQNPINTVTIQSAANDISWANTGDQATALGLEVESRKVLMSRESEYADFTNKQKLTTGVNLAYMKTKQTLSGDKVFQESGLSFDPTYSSTGITGASDLVANADISFFKDFKEHRNILLTLAGNYFSDRIFALGNFGKGNIVEKGVPTLDFVARAQFTKQLSVGISAKNLLNPSIERFQEAVDGDVNPIRDRIQETATTVLSFKRGYDLKISLNYIF
ncbi:MAG: TonB-dependent receptor domain-containing protein [Flavobacteriaceae bacterium]